METPQQRDKQPWKPELFEYKKLRFLQYFCNFEETPLDKNITEVPSDFDANKTKKELLEFILDLDLTTFEVELETDRSVPIAAILRNMLIDHFGLIENSTALTYKQLANKYKIGVNKTQEIFNRLFDKIREQSTF